MTEPTGNVTFLFTDIEGSSKLAQLFVESYPGALIKHTMILHESVKSNSGFVFKTIGDAFCCAFQNADDAVNAAIDVHVKLGEEKWNEVDIKVRIGIHSGNARWNGEDYVGYISLAIVSRVMSAAYSEQIIISESTFDLLKESISDKVSFRHLGQRRLKDVIKPTKLFQIISHGLREDFPPIKTIDARQNNLPLQLTNFIGRETEMKQVKDLLKQTQLLSILGSGGAGKTRFALQVAADMIDEFENGVFIAELAPVSDPSFLIQTILNSLKIKEEGSCSPEETLKVFLTDKELLLILDNCEHLKNESANLAEMLLSNCPTIKIIATSREVLNCSGEQTYRLPSLSVPDIKSDNTPEKLSQFESVRLFIERALSVNSNFQVNNMNAPALAEICIRLDGIPLAIELAAARIKVLTVDKICERLTDRFLLLTGGRITDLPRQQTLKALIDWSYDLLSDKEKILWERLSVFTGGWTLESAEEICSDEKIKVKEILDLLKALTEKSIIVYDIDIERYRILETLKQYGEEKLRESEMKEDILLKHLIFFLSFAEGAVPKLNSNEIHLWLKKLESDHGNFESAINWSLSASETDKGVRLAAALGNFWDIRGYYSVGRQLLERFILNTQGMNKSLSVNILRCSGILAAGQSDYEQAQKYFEECLLLSRELGEKHSIAKSLNHLGGTIYFLGEYAQAQKYYEESLLLYREIGDKDGLAACLHNFGNTLGGLKKFELGQKYLEESLSIRIEIKDKRGMASCLMSLGLIAYYKSNADYMKAIKFYKECIELSREIGLKSELAITLYNVGDCIESNDENFENALNYFEEALAIFQELGHKFGIASSFNGLGNIAYRKSNFEEAKNFYEEALSKFLEMKFKSGIANSLNGLGNVAFGISNFEEAENHYKECHDLRCEDRDKRGIADSLLSLGLLKHKTGNYEESQKYYEESLELYLEVKYDRGIISALRLLGNIDFSRGNIEKVRKLFEESLALNTVSESKLILTEALIGFVGICISVNDLSKSAMLLGAVEAAFKSNNELPQRIESELQKKLIRSRRIELQEKLSSEEFSKYFNEGLNMTIYEAAELALSNFKC